MEASDIFWDKSNCFHAWVEFSWKPGEVICYICRILREETDDASS